MKDALENAYQCVTNWRFWIALIFWFPLVLPFAVIEVVLDLIEWLLEQASLKVRLFNIQINKLFTALFLSKSVSKWVNENRKDRKCKKQE